MTSGYTFRNTWHSPGDGPIFSPKRIVCLSLIFAGVMAAFAGLLLVSPGNPLTRLVKSRVVAESDSVIIGPYPLKEDFPALKSAGVRIIVTLLDARLPYEAILLEREQALAAQNGMEFLNFPMTSVAGQPMGAAYSANAEQAAIAVEQASRRGKVYLHCYLGLHRAQTVMTLLRSYNHPAAAAAGSGRPGNAELLNQARQAFDQGRYSDTVRLTGEIDPLSGTGRLLRAWAQYRQGRIAEAQNDFAEVIAHHPGIGDASAGLAYTHLRQGNLEAAEKIFRQVIAADPNNINAQQGLGITLFRQARAEEARVVLRKALSIDPANPEVREILAKLE